MTREAKVILFCCLFTLAGCEHEDTSEVHSRSTGSSTEALSNSGAAGVAPVAAEAIKSSKKPQILADNAGSGIRVDLTVPETATYWLRAWANGVSGQERIDFYIDNAKRPAGFIRPTDAGWQFHDLTAVGSATGFSLQAGAHTLSFRAQGDHVPDVEFVEASKNKFVASASDQNFLNFAHDVGTRSLPPEYKSQKASGLLPIQTAAVAAAAGPFPGDNYCSQLNLPFVYTYRASFNFNANQSVVFETRKADPYGSDPVLYLFHTAQPTLAGWSNDDYNGLQSRIAVTIRTAGPYTLLARAYDPNNSGTSDLYKDGNLFASSITLWGAKLDCGLGATGTLNYFTSYLQQVGGAPDSVMYLVDNVGSWPFLIGSFNDDFSGGGDFAWGFASRIHRTSPQTISSAIITSFSSQNPFGIADVYLEAPDSDILTPFPNLKAIDAIKAAPSTGGAGQPGAYNCISYSGGIVGSWEWPPDPASPWYSPNPLTAFDKFYGNTPSRPISSPWTYTRTGATYDNSLIDLWALNGTYTHASVKKPGNDWPHGYDWESKPGSLTRTFHPRRSLRGNNYGDVVNYYIRSGTAAAAATGTSTAASTMLVDAERPALTQTETAKLTGLKSAAAPAVTAQFERLYSAWKATWNRPEIAVQSDPRMYAQSSEYSNLLTFCKAQGRSLWPLLFDKYSSGDFFAYLPIQDVTLPEQQTVLERVRGASAVERFTADGKYVGPSLSANMMNFVKEVLASM